MIVAAFDPTTFFNNPLGQAFSSYTGLMGLWFYAGMMLVIGGYVLMKTESWAAASGILLVGSIIFSALLPPYIIFIIAIALALAFTFVLVDIFVLK